MDLSKRLYLSQLSLQDIDALDDMQAGILAPGGFLHSAAISLRFDYAVAGRAFLAELSRHVLTALEQVLPRRARSTSPAPIVNVHLSRDGYRALAIDPAHWPGDTVFQQGLKMREASLTDPPYHLWEEHYRDGVDGLITIWAASAAEVAATAQRLLGAAPTGVRVLRTEIGRAWTPQGVTPTAGGLYFGPRVEHFGFTDGTSNPLLIRNDATEDTGGGWHAPLSLVLVPCPGGITGVSYGSYFVYRKLEQNVHAFLAAERQVASRLEPAAHPDLAGAMIMGRYRDGTPLVLTDTPSGQAVPDNAFDYDHDPAGRRCPFHAHIRKVNPRGETVRNGHSTSLDQERSHMIVRRGISYGDRTGHPSMVDNIDALPSSNVGLLFMCYQANIAQQFEYLQRAFANHIDHPAGGAWQDAVIGQGVRGPHSWPRQWNSSNPPEHFEFPQTVSLKGGEYFFTPSLTFLRGLN